MSAFGDHMSAFGDKADMTFALRMSFDTTATRKSLILSVFSRQSVGLAAVDTNTRIIVIGLFILAAIFALAMGGLYLR